MIEGLPIRAAAEGGLLGLAWCMGGWAKNSKPGKFDLRGLAVKVPVGIAVGVYASLNGISLASAEGMLAGSGAINTIDYAAKMLWRRLASKFKGALNWEMGG